MQNWFRFYRSNEGNFKIKTKNFNYVGNRENSDILIKIFDKKALEFLTRLTPTCSEVIMQITKKMHDLYVLTLFQNRHFRGCKRIGRGGAKKPPALKFVTHILQ